MNNRQVYKKFRKECATHGKDRAKRGEGIAQKMADELGISTDVFYKNLREEALAQLSKDKAYKKVIKLIEQGLSVQEIKDKLL